MWLLSGCVDPSSSTPLGDTSPGETGSSATDSADSGTSGDTATGDTAPPVVYPTPCDAWAAPRDIGALVDPELNEVSGVEPSDAHPGVLWVHEDHGGAAAFYALDWTGVTLGVVTLDGVENVDMEGMAIGPCETGSCLWLADVGDNLEVRLDPVLYRIPEPDVTLAGGLDIVVTPDVFPVQYDDGAAENVEGFALTADGSPVLFTKRGDGWSRVYIADEPLVDQTTILRRIGSFATRATEAELGGHVTSADLWPDGTRLLLRTYERAWEMNLGDLGIEGVETAPSLDLPFSPVVHVEAIAYDANARGYWQIPEGVNAPISYTACLD